MGGSGEGWTKGVIVEGQETKKGGRGKQRKKVGRRGKETEIEGGKRKTEGRMRKGAKGGNEEETK